LCYLRRGGTSKLLNFKLISVLLVRNKQLALTYVPITVIKVLTAHSFFKNNSNKIANILKIWHSVIKSDWFMIFRGILLVSINNGI